MTIHFEFLGASWTAEVTDEQIVLTPARGMARYRVSAPGGGLQIEEREPADITSSQGVADGSAASA